MIKKIDGCRNGYDITEATREEWNDLVDSIDVKTIYMNKYTRKFFRFGLLSRPCITITNKLMDMVVYFNGIY